VAGSWYTEQEYESSAQLADYLAARYGIPLDREHLLGHDDVPGPLNGYVAGMHWDPGPWWDWSHYLDLLGAPVIGLHRTPRAGQAVTIDPPYDSSYQPAITGCGAAAGACPPHPVNFVALHTAPAADAPLVQDPIIGAAGSGTTAGYDWSDKAVVGQTFVVADQQGEWTGIWYGGQEAWFDNPGNAYAVVSVLPHLTVTPKGTAPIPVYGRYYPETSAYPAALASSAAPLTPLSYTLPAGQHYTATAPVQGTFYYAQNINCSATPDCVMIIGRTAYYPIRFNHRLAYVKADDVTAGLEP
jgi:hypothetical protein